MFEKILDWRAQQHPARAAIWSEAGEISYGLLARHVAQMTTALDLEELPPGVVLVGRITPALIWLLTLALERLDRTTAVAPELTVDEVRIIRPSVVLTRDGSWKPALGERVLEVSDAWCRRALRQKPSARRSNPKGDDLVRIILSSGTTGVRKQVPITRSLIDVRVGRPLLGSPAPQLRYLQSQGMDTIAGFQHPLTVWSNGGLVIIPKVISADLFRVQKPNLTAASPNRLRTMLPLMKSIYSSSDRIHVRAIGSALPPTLITEAMACDGVDVSVSYGSTEAGNITSGPASLAVDRPGSVGFVAPWVDLQIVDEDGRLVEPGQSGVIRVRGEGVLDGYQEGDLNGSAFRGGWFYPGDMGRISSDGVLIIDGRRDDVVNIGGVKVSSTRIEETVIECSGVEDAAVIAFAMTSGRWALFAAVVAPKGFSSDEIRQKILAIYKVHLELIDLPEIARNAMGKIKRAAVREAIISKQNSSAGGGEPGNKSLG